MVFQSISRGRFGSFAFLDIFLQNIMEVDWKKTVYNSFKYLTKQH